MGDIQRYKMIIEGAARYPSEQLSQFGKWVKHKDHLKAIEDKDAEFERLRAALTAIAAPSKGDSLEVIAKRHIAENALSLTDLNR